MTTEKQSFFESNRDVLIIAGLAVLVLAVYAQTSGFQFINFDDNFYVYENPVVKSGLNWESVKWAFTAYYAGNWHPLTWLSLQLDVQLFGAAPGMHHVMNVILHLANSVLAFVVFRTMTGRFWASAAVAALFAVHPAHVESVAWISERKDLLCTVFWFASMWFYIRWCQEGARPWTGMYWAALGMFALGLMSKPMVITLPFVLLLCDVWPLERTGEGKKKDYMKLAVEKTPFFALSIASAFITVAAQRTAAAVESLTALPLDVRIKNSVLSYAKYVVTAVYPSRLGVWYPYDKEISTVEFSLAAILLIAVTAVCVWQFGQRKYLLVGWLWFVGTLVPVIGLVQVGGQSMADRYTYIPYFGLFIMAVFGAAELIGSLRIDRRLVTAAAAGVIAVLALFAYVQASYWRDNETLYTRTLSVTKNNFLIAQNLCAHLTLEGRLDEAEVQCRASLDVKPNYYAAQNGIGMIEFGRKNYARAETEFAKAVAIEPNTSGTYSNLALSQVMQGKPADAEATLEKAASLQFTDSAPTIFVPVLKGIASAYMSRQNYQKAYDNLARALFLTPDDLGARTGIAMVLFELKRIDESQTQIEAVLGSDPGNAVAHNLYGMILTTKQKPDLAAGEFEAALRLKPDYPEAKANLERIKGGK